MQWRPPIPLNPKGKLVQSDRTYNDVREAAELLATNASRDRWTLADAVLAHVPGRPNGRNAAHVGPVSEALTDLANMLAADGVVNSRGDSWSPVELANLRDTAMAWAPATRLPVCAFHVHREAKGTDRQAALRTLVAYAEGEPADVPTELADRINSRKARHARYLVTVDDMRLFRGASPSSMRRHDQPPATAAQVAEALHDPEVLSEAMALMPPERVQAARLAALAAAPATQDADVQTSQRVVRRARAAGPTGYESDVAQSNLALKAYDALVALAETFEAYPPAPDGLARRALTSLPVGYARVMAAAMGTDDLDEGLRILLGDAT